MPFSSLNVDVAGLTTSDGNGGLAADDRALTSADFTFSFSFSLGFVLGDRPPDPEESDAGGAWSPGGGMIGVATFLRGGKSGLLAWFGGGPDGGAAKPESVRGTVSPVTGGVCVPAAFLAERTAR